MRRSGDLRLPLTPAPKHGMVRWYSPGLLLSTGIQVLIAAALGQRADYRMMEDVSLPQKVFDYSRIKKQPRREIWFDYLADTGDGWNPTYAVASLVAQPKLRVGDRELPRGRFLLLGGDEVYPVASQREYRERLVAPFEAALPESKPPYPHLFAIPGNHDWYDGLVSFSRRFSQKRWIGGWITRQRRSYFALRLPHHWWLWAVDVQLESDIDLGQRDYFRRIARQLQPGDRIILASAEPDWLYRDIKDPVAESNLAYLEEKIIQPRQASVRVWLAGDLHHYRRHQHADDPGIQRIASGGGGAYLSATHRSLFATEGSALKRTVRVGKERFEQQCAYPSPMTSFRLSLLNSLFIIKNWSFGLLTGVIYLALAWGQVPKGLPWEEAELTALLGQPARVAWVLVILAGFVFYADRYSPLFRVIGGVIHGCVHIAAALLLASWTAGVVGDGRFAVVWQLLLNFLGGALLGPTILGFYLLIALNGFGAHADQAFSSLRIQDFKHFLRFHITPSGSLEIFPVAIDRVPREGEGQAQYRLIEGPVRIAALWPSREPEGAGERPPPSRSVGAASGH